MMILVVVVGLMILISMVLVISTIFVAAREDQQMCELMELEETLDPPVIETPTV